MRSRESLEEEIVVLRGKSRADDILIQGQYRYILALEARLNPPCINGTLWWQPVLAVAKELKP